MCKLIDGQIKPFVFLVFVPSAKGAFFEVV